MHTSIKTIISVCCIATLIGATACSESNKFIGTWTATLPESIDNEIPAASTASALLSIEFIADENVTNSGTVNISQLISIAQAVEGDTTSFSQSYEVSVAATASISGSWTMDKDDDDEIFIVFHPTTLSVNVDPDGVTFSQNVLTGAQQPAIDQLTEKTIALWKNQITKAFIGQLAQFQAIEDIEVHKNVLTFEIEGKHGHDKKLSFRRVVED